VHAPFSQQRGGLEVALGGVTTRPQVNAPSPLSRFCYLWVWLMLFSWHMLAYAIIWETLLLPIHWS